MKVYKSTVGMSREDWLESRRAGIGGSDAAAVIGVNPWKTAYSVYLDKIGEGNEPDSNYKMELGSRIEDFIAKEFELATGKQTRRRNAILRHDEHKFMLANIDREIVGERAGLEIKFIGPYSAKAWEAGGMPLHYELQCLHYMAVTGYDKWYLCALVGNERLELREISRDEEVISNLIEAESFFWENHVVAKIPPEPGTCDLTDFIKRVYPVSIAGASAVIESQTGNLDRLIEVKELIKKLEEEKEVLENHIKIAIGEAETGINSRYNVTFKTAKRETIDAKKLKNDHAEIFKDDTYIKKSTYRVLKVTPLKEKETV
ncbi:YqaJ viral recombinase family protein [Bacteroides heparinolyticus]|uniref:YqaJ viral recombinase family nuclease n=1 Tax=Prevotella heparinolytica TaxID=28113 RepID=UPI0035A0E5BC